MITFAAIAPHSPLLLPAIGKAHHEKLKKTLAAYKTLADDFDASKSETVLVFSPHGPAVEEAFPLFISPQYAANLKEFGDFATTFTVHGDMRLLETLRRLRLGPDPTPITGLTEEFLDYGTAIPLLLLAARWPAIHLVPMGTASLPLAAHFEAGKKIGETVQQSTTRIALIASADLAQTLTDNAPGGFSPEGKKFDAALVRALRKNDRAAILKLESGMEAAKACGLRSIAMLLGALDTLNCAAEPLAYEGPFGVGYLVARFNFR